MLLRSNILNVTSKIQKIRALECWKQFVNLLDKLPLVSEVFMKSSLLLQVLLWIQLGSTRGAVRSRFLR